MRDNNCGTCIYFNGDMSDEQPQFCDEKEVYVLKYDYCSKYREDLEKKKMKD